MIENKVTNSKLKSIDLADFITQGERMAFDLEKFLFQGLVLKEKDFRMALKNLDWSIYHDKHIYILCSANAIVPTWAFMLVITYLNPIAKTVIQGSLADLERVLLQKRFDQLKEEDYKDAKVVIKGCSELFDPIFAFSAFTIKVQPWVSSLMYGEPCSTVPVYKKKKN